MVGILRKGSLDDMRNVDQKMLCQAEAGHLQISSRKIRACVSSAVLILMRQVTLKRDHVT